VSQGFRVQGRASTPRRAGHQHLVDHAPCAAAAGAGRPHLSKDRISELAWWLAGVNRIPWHRGGG
jgi:hypothetical protein